MNTTIDNLIQEVEELKKERDKYKNAYKDASERCDKACDIALQLVNEAQEFNKKYRDTLDENLNLKIENLNLRTWRHPDENKV